MKKRMMGILLALSLCLTLLPIGAGAAAGLATETADFTVGGGTEAIALLNTAKTGSAESTWDNGSNTLTLRGIDFTTTATTAVKLPANSKIVLADGTENKIKGGDAAAEATGKYNNNIYIYGIYAEGALTIKGETAGTGTLSITSGAHTNTGDASTYSAAIYGKGNLKVEGGTVTATGGEAVSSYMAFSIGLYLPDRGNLSVTGGTLTAIAGESYTMKDGVRDHAEFSQGVCLYGGNVTVSGSGKLNAESVRTMAEAGLLSNGLCISRGDLTISNNGEVSVSGGYGAYISDGGIQLYGGKLTAASTREPDANGNLPYALSVGVSDGTSTANAGNITVSGGTLETKNGYISMSTTGAENGHGLFTVTGGTIKNSGQIYGAKKLDISGGTVQTQGVEVDALALSGGTLTIREAVRKNPYHEKLFVRPAVDASTLTVGNGTLDAAWDWGEFTPIVFPVSTYYGYADPLVKITGNNSSATFNGGTTILDTRCAGNNALLINGTLTLGDGIAETGANTNSAGEHKQEYSDTPVVFSDVTRTPVTVTAATALDKPYDGTAAARLGAISFTGLTPEDERTHLVSIEGLAAEFASKDVDTAIQVTVTGGTFVLHGANAYKYYFPTQPTDLSGLTANITHAYAVLADAAILTQTIRVGEGSSFQHPTFKGVGSEPATGTVSYTYNINDDTNLVYTIERDTILTLLNGLSAGDKAYIGYEFIGSDNYSPDPLTGTITVTMRARSGSTSSGSSSYAVYVVKTSNGSVTASPKNASKDDTVTITIKPDSGYTLETLTVTDSKGNELALTDKGNGKYTFTMPASRVEVKATFMEDNSLLNFFYDVPNSAYYYEAVKWAVEQGVTTGIGNNLFGPDQPCTRAQIVTFLWRAAGSPEPKAASSFSDVSADSYYAKAVAWAIENGVTTGVGGDRFAPDDACTRAQAVTLLARARSAKAEGSAAFSDVPADSYYADAVAWAAASGITEGIGGGLFGPADDCTRAQIVTFFWRAYTK